MSLLKFDLFSLLIAASISFEVLNIVLIKSKMTKLGKSHDTILLFPKFMIRSALMFLLMHFNKVLMLTDLFLTNVESTLDLHPRITDKIERINL